MRLVCTGALALSLGVSGLPAAADPYTTLLALSEVGLGQTATPALGETLSLMTREYRIEVWIPENRQSCRVSLFRVVEVQDDDPDIFTYDDIRLANHVDPDCSGTLQRRDGAGTATMPSSDLFWTALTDFGQPPFDAVGISNSTMDAAFAIRDRLSDTFLDLAPGQRRVESYRLRLSSDRIEGNADMQVIFDGDDGVCTLYLGMEPSTPLLTANIVLLPAPRNSRTLELQDNNCDGMFDLAFLDFSSVELGLGGYLINGRWVAQSAQLMAAGLAVMDWTDALIRATR